MREYKIVEYPEGTFKSYIKRWWGWSCFEEDYGIATLKLTFLSRNQAQKAIEKFEREKRKYDMDKKTWYLNGNTID